MLDYPQKYFSGFCFLIVHLKAVIVSKFRILGETSFYRTMNIEDFCPKYSILIDLVLNCYTCLNSFITDVPIIRRFLYDMKLHHETVKS